MAVSVWIQLVSPLVALGIAVIGGWRQNKRHDREIKTPSDLSIGFNMCKDDMVELKSKSIPTDVEKLADKLREVYNELSKAKL